MSSKRPAGSHFHLKYPTKEGWLEKQSKILKLWKKRWIVLQDSTIYCFKKERTYDDPTAIIDLRIFSSLKSSDDFTGRLHSFDIYAGEKVFSFVAPSKQVKDDWMKTVQDEILNPKGAKDWKDQFRNNSVNNNMIEADYEGKDSSDDDEERMAAQSIASVSIAPKSPPTKQPFSAAAAAPAAAATPRSVAVAATTAASPPDLGAAGYMEEEDDDDSDD